MASSKPKHPEKSFFSQLRRLCVTVEKDVASLQAMANDQTSEQSDETSAILLLSKIQEEVEMLKVPIVRVHLTIIKDNCCHSYFIV